MSRRFCRLAYGLMYQAFLAVKKNRGAAAVDRVSIGMFENNLEQNLTALMRDLKGRSFRPQPARRTYHRRRKKEETAGETAISSWGIFYLFSR